MQNAGHPHDQAVAAALHTAYDRPWWRSGWWGLRSSRYGASSTRWNG
jgi:hypothetical protein